MSKLTPPTRKLTPDEQFHGGGGEPFTVGDFWRWAFSELKDNTTRGIVAEYLVAQALGATAAVRQNWADVDLTTREGPTVEVKASAYLQSWEQRGPSKIKFSGLAARALGPLGTYVGTPAYRAKVYVFCVQTERDPAKYDALAIFQWAFLVVPRTALPVPLQSTIGLERLSRLPGAVPARFAELAMAVKQAAAYGAAP